MHNISMKFLYKLFVMVFSINSFQAANALDLNCVMNRNTPAAFVKHISNASLEILVQIDNGRVTKFSNEKILKSRKEIMTYEIDFSGDASASINRESLRLKYFNNSMVRAGNLGGYYGNSREPGADYDCRLLNQKI